MDGALPLAYPRGPSRSAMTTALLIFSLYLVGTVALGLWAARRGKSDQEDYFLAGRGLSALSMALSAVSSGRSAWLIVSASAAAWAAGLSAIWIFPGYIAVESLLFVTVGPRLRRRSAEVGAITVSEALASIAPSSRLPIRALAGLMTILFLLTYVSAQLGAGAKTIGAVFDIDGSTWGLVLTAAIVLVYTVLGGYRAVVITDVVQAILMLCGMIALPWLGLVAVGGFDALGEKLRAIDPALLDGASSSWGILGGLCIGFGSLGNPHILVRHMSLADPSQARVAMVTGTFWNIVMAAGALLLGLIGRALYPDLDALGGERELLFATISTDLSSQYLFAGFVGLLLATLFAAIMSTCDSQLLVIAASFLRDFRSKKKERVGGLLLSRLAVLVTLVGAVALSYGDIPIINNLVLLSWGVLGLAFGPAILFLLYDRRTSAPGVFFGVLTGALSATAAWYFFARPAGKSLTYELLPAFAATCFVLVLLRRKPA